MKRPVLLLLLLLLTLQTAALSALALAQDREPSRIPTPSLPGAASIAGDCELLPGPNLLNNPSFEGEYHAYVPPGGHDDCPLGVCGTAQMADGWTPYWLPNSESDRPTDAMPEYKPATTEHQNPPRVHSGERAQQYFTFFKTHEAGFYQQIAVTPGVNYCFSIWGHSWSSNQDEPDQSDSTLEMWIGIDPTGGANWQSDSVVWGPPIQQYNEYALFSIKATAQGSQLTVFTKSRPIWAVKHNDVYWDTATLKATSGSATMTVTPGNLHFIAEEGAPQVASGQILIDLSGYTDIGWTAVLEPGGSLSPSISPASGTGSTLVTITVDSSGRSVGVYSAQLTISANSDIPGSPTTVPITLDVVSELHHLYVPLNALEATP